MKNQIKATKRIEDAISNLVDLKRRREALETLEKEFKDEIRSFVDLDAEKEAAVKIVNAKNIPLATVSNSLFTIIDSKELLDEKPEVWEQFCKTSFRQSVRLA